MHLYNGAERSCFALDFDRISPWMNFFFCAWFGFAVCFVEIGTRTKSKCMIHRPLSVVLSERFCDTLMINYYLLKRIASCVSDMSFRARSTLSRGKHPVNVFCASALKKYYFVVVSICVMYYYTRICIRYWKCLLFYALRYRLLFITMAPRLCIREYRKSIKFFFWSIADTQRYNVMNAQVAYASTAPSCLT